MLLVNVPNRMYPKYSKIFLLNLTQFNPVASPPENQKYILVHTTFFSFFFLITQIAPNSRILLSRVLNGNGRFCSSYEVSPSSFRYYSSSVEYLSGILTKTKLHVWLFSLLRNIFFCVLNAACKKAQGNLFFKRQWLRISLKCSCFLQCYILRFRMIITCLFQF